MDSKYPIEWFIDFDHFPTDFTCMDEAIGKYNELGYPLKIQFKKYNTSRDKNDARLSMFSLCCHKRGSKGFKDVN